MKSKFSLILALLAFQSSLGFGQTSAVPGTISYQGRVFTAAGALVGAGAPVNRTVIFRIWDSPSATTLANLLYSETQTVTIAEGEFSVLVGNGIANPTQTFGYSETARHSSASPAVALADVFNGSSRFLSVTVANAATITTADAEITPRQQIVSSAFAFRSRFAETLGTSTSGSSLRVLDNGFVGVGNASPPSIFTVTGANSSNAAAPQLLITATDTTERLRLGVNDIGNGTGFIQAFKEGSGAQNLTLNSEGGNVGIGTKTPGNQLTVQRTMGSNDTVFGQHSYQFQIQNGIGTRSLGIGVLDNGRAVVQAKEMNLGYSDLLLNPAGGRVGIGSASPLVDTFGVVGTSSFSGNVGIGISSPAVKLTVATGVNGLPSTTGTSQPAAALRLRGGNNAVLDFGVNSSAGSWLQSTDQLDQSNRYPLLLNPRGGNVGIGNSAPANPLSVTGNADFSGNVGIGTTVPGFPLNFASTAGDKISLFGNSGAHYGFGIGSNLLQIHADNSASDVAFGYGSSAAFTETMRVKGNGNVGIGNSNPVAPLHVSSYVPMTYYVHATMDTISARNIRTNISTYVGAIIDHRLRATAFDVSSDERIKNVIGKSDAVPDLATLMSIEVTDYKLKDTVNQGTKPQKKVIAQQVEKVFPQAVNQQTGVVPDIFKKASVKDGWIELVTDLKKGERVKVISEKSQEVHEVLEVEEGKFRCDLVPDGALVFVYGREVSDMRAVDYDAIAMLNVSATQQIKKELDAVKIENAELKTQRAELKTQMAALKAAVAHVAEADQAHEDRLLAIEQRLSGATKATLPISIQNKGAAE